MKRSNHGNYNSKVESKPVQAALNPDKPVVYVTTAEHGCALVFVPEHDRLPKLNSTGIEMWKLLSNGESETEVRVDVSFQIAEIVRDRHLG